MQEYFDNEHFSDEEEEKNTFEIDVQSTKPIKKAPESESTSIYKRNQ